MSGGAFNISGYQFEDIIERLNQEITNNNKPPFENPDNNWDKLENERFYMLGGYRYTSATINAFKEAINVFKQASIYCHRIDWLLSGDDGEMTFLLRLKEDLKKLK